MWRVHAHSIRCVDSTSEKRAPWAWSYGMTAAPEMQKGEIDASDPQTSLPLQEHGAGGQEGGTTRTKKEPNLRASRCVTVVRRAWQSGMLSPSCALRPGTWERLKGVLPPGPSGNTTYSQLARAHQPDAKTPLWPMNYKWGGPVGRVYRSFFSHVTRVPLVLQHF